jgi:hypothetical protein
MPVVIRSTRDEKPRRLWFDKLTMSGLIPLTLSLSKGADSVYS